MVEGSDYELVLHGSTVGMIAAVVLFLSVRVLAIMPKPTTAPNLSYVRRCPRSTTMEMTPCPGGGRRVFLCNDGRRRHF